MIPRSVWDMIDRHVETVHTVLGRTLGTRRSLL